MCKRVLNVRARVGVGYLRTLSGWQRIVSGVSVPALDASYFFTFVILSKSALDAPVMFRRICVFMGIGALDESYFVVWIVATWN